MARVKKGEATRKAISEADIGELKEIRGGLLRRFRSDLNKLDKLDQSSVEGQKEDKFDRGQKLTIRVNRLGKSLFECFRIQYSLPEEESKEEEEEEEEDLALAMEKFEKREQPSKKQLMTLKDHKDYHQRIQRLKQQLMVLKHYDDQFNDDNAKTGVLAGFGTAPTRHTPKRRSHLSHLDRRLAKL